MSWKQKFKRGSEVVLVSATKSGKPNAIVVVSLGFLGNELVIADCQMKNTVRNVGTNPGVCVVGSPFKVVGSAKLFSSGKYFDFCVKHSDGYDVKHAIVIRPNAVIDLDKVKRIV